MKYYNYPNGTKTAEALDSENTAVVKGPDGKYIAPNELPAITANDKGKIVRVKADGTGIEYTGEAELPPITSADGGKVCKVKSDHSGVEWGEAGGGTPVGQILWQGTVTSTPQEVVDGLQAFNFLPVAVATLNGKIAKFSYEEDETEVFFGYDIEGVASIILTFDLESHKVFVVAEGEGSDSGIDVVIADVGNRCYIADATYQADSIYINTGNVSLFNQLMEIGAALFIHIHGTYNSSNLNTMLPATIDVYSAQLHLSTIGSCCGQNVTWTIDGDGYFVGSINNGGGNQ